MAGPSISDSSNAEEIAAALFNKLALQSSDLRRTRYEFSIEELDRLDSSMLSISRSMGTIRNAFAPVNILPSEVLAQVFEILAQHPKLPSEFLPDLEGCERPYDWVTVTHVCRYWRETALSFPALWSNIDSCSTLAALTFLNRSAATDVRVYLRDAIGTSGISPCLDRGRSLQGIAHHSERYEQLHIQPAFRYGPIILRCFQYPAPKLRALTIMLNLNKEGTHELPLLFDGHIPNLEKLTLAGFSQWPLHQFGGKLTHLCLMDQPLRGRMSMDRFVDFLSSCEVLEELVLIDAGPNVWDAPDLVNSERKLVHLEHLKTLHIGDWHTPQCIAQFLEHLILPRTTKLFIWADCLFRREELFSMLLPGSLKHLHPFHRLTTIHLTYRPATRDYPQLLSVQDGVLVFYLHFAMPTTADMLESVFSQINLLNVEELTLGIHSKPELPETTWRTIFYMMPRVHTLNILRRSSRPILAALSPENLTDEVPCPGLKLLTITDDRAVSSIRLFLFAEERAQRGIPLRRLQVVSRMNMYSYRLEDEMQDMRSKVAEVEYVEDECVDVKQLPAGWPTATYRWLLDMRDGRNHYAVN